MNTFICQIQTIFSTNAGGIVVDRMVSVFDSLIHSGYIRDRSLKMAKSRRLLDVFAFPNFRAANVEPKFSCLPRGTSRGKVS